MDKKFVYTLARYSPVLVPAILFGALADAKGWPPTSWQFWLVLIGANFAFAITLIWRDHTTRMNMLDVARAIYNREIK